MLPFPLTLDLESIPVVTAAFHLVSDDGINATPVRDTAATLTGWTMANVAPAWRWLKLFDVAGIPDVGIDPVAVLIGLPPGGGSNLAPPGGVLFEAGIALALTAGADDSDTSPVGSGDVAGTLFLE